MAPGFTFFQVAKPEFPSLFRRINPRLKALFLLLFADMKKKLKDGCPLIRQQAFEIADVFEPASPDGLRSNTVYSYNEDIFVMTPVENDDFSLSR